MLGFLGNNLKRKLILLLIFPHHISQKSTMKTNIVIDIFPPYLAKFWVSSYGPKCCQPIKLQDSLKCNLFKKKWTIKLIFCLQTIIKAFCKMILLLLVFAATHAQSTKNNKFTISLKYFKKNVENEVDFVPADKC